MWVERPRYVKVYKSREDGSLWYHKLNAQEAHPFNPDETVFYLEKDVNDLMAGIDIVIENKAKCLEESTEKWKKEFAEKADKKLREKEEFMVEMLQIATKKFVEQELKNTPHNWRRYCGLGNFNIDLASFEVVKSSHNKNRYQRENIGYDGLEYHKPKRCPLLRK